MAPCFTAHITVKHIATDHCEEQTGTDWIKVDAVHPTEEKENKTTLIHADAVHSPGEDENDPPEEDERDATPLGETTENPKVPHWAEKGARAPLSFDDLMSSTPEEMLRCRTQTTCQHNKLKKTGTNYFQARITCADCGELMALCRKHEASAAQIR